jgi:hypothetical protein
MTDIIVDQPNLILTVEAEDQTVLLNQTQPAILSFEVVGVQGPPGSGGGATDLTYDAATRTVESSTGTDAVLPLVSLTAAGLAEKIAVGPKRTASFNDFISATSGSDWAVASSGTGAAQAQVAPPDTGAGWVNFNLGTTTTGRTALTTGLFAFKLEDGPADFGARCQIGVLSDATNTFSIRLGFIDNVSGESVDGVFFRYTHSVNGGRFQAVCRSNNVETGSAADTGVTVATATTYTFEIAVDASIPQAVFKINGATVATVTTNIPAAFNRATGAGVMGLKSAGTTATTALVMDYVFYDMTIAGR